LEPKPVAVYRELADDSHTAVAVGDRLLGVHNGLHYLDLSAGLKPIWVGADPELDHYSSIVATDTRALIVTMAAEAILVDPRAPKFAILDRRSLIEDEGGLYSHPAYVGKRMFVRGS